MHSASRFNNPVVLCLAGYLVAVPLLIPLVTTSVSAYDAARVAQLALLPVMAGLGVNAALPALSQPMRGALVVLSILGLLSCTLAANSWMALRESLNLGCLIAIAAVLAAQRRATLDWLPKAAALAVMAYAVPVLILALMGAVHGLPLAADLPLPGYDNRRYFNHVQTVALPLAAYGVIRFRSPLLRYLTGAGLLASMVLLWITLGRGSLLGMAAAVGVLAVLRLRGRREVQAQLVILAGGLLLAATLSTLIQTYAASTSLASGFGRAPAAAEVSSDHSRFSLWQRAWEMATASPWLGVGPMHYAADNHEKGAHPHSLPLQLLAEWGWPATLLIGLIWASLMVAMARRLRTSSGCELQLGACALACWASVFVDSWFSGLWVMPVSQMWLVALMGLSGAWLSQAPPPLSAVAARRWSVMPLLLSIALLLHAAPEVMQLRAHLDSVEETFPGDRIRPRFWSHGQIGPSAPSRSP